MAGHAESGVSREVSDATAEEPQAPVVPKGVIYLSKIPKSFTRSKVIDYFGKFGEVTNCWLNPEEEYITNRRRKTGKVGGIQRRYVDGWVEFEDKRHAKRTAKQLDGQEVGGVSNLKKNPDYFDTWHVRYLPKFQWYHLETQEFYKKDQVSNLLAVKMRQLSKQNFEYRQRLIRRAEHRSSGRRRHAGDAPAFEA
ncbi:MAG: hypothetical protein KVP17_002780 [Porospora cf. gigantea B]|uniref:uncharacterized protein n=1 Tax=Porospora cf. gigantea B TaxID=2853592 RepID=UPI0035717E58|nr:MAG: hypothetical protein KVP17_002780 [Porospora cf. gigantea B]